MLVEYFAKTLGKTPAREDFEGLTWGFYQSARPLPQRNTNFAGRACRLARDKSRDGNSPTTPGSRLCWARPPLEIGALNLDETDVMKGLAPILGYVPFTALQNVTGQPAISLPLAWSKSGLPIGVQFVGRFGEEHLLLQLAAQIERAEPWSKKRPPVYG